MRMKNLRVKVVTMVLLASAMSAQAEEAAAYAKRVFNIQPQSTEKALTEFGLATGLQVLFETKVTAGHQSPAVTGELSTREALERLLMNSSLKYEFVNDKTVRIVPLAFVPQYAPERTNIQAAGVMRLAQTDMAESSEDSPETAISENKSSSSFPTPEGRESRLVEEIIVTATKRAESIHDVPVSITAIGNAEIESRGLRGMGDYLSAVPGASVVELSAASNAIVIRGIDTGPVFQNFGAGATVATYFGETPITDTAGLLGGSGIDLKLVDIERIEVLRGPQGTSFGNSSLGGAVRTIPVAPQLAKFGGKLVGSYSHTGGAGGTNNMLQGVFNAPLIQDKLALRVVGYRYDNSGYYRNVSASDALITEYAASLGPQALSLLRSDGDRGADRQAGARAALLWQATENMKLTLSYLHQKIEQDGYASGFDALGRYNYTGFRLPSSRGTRGNQDSVFDNVIDISNMTFEYDLGWADLVASASWIDAATDRNYGAVVDGPYDWVSRSPHQAFSSEIRLVSRLDGPLQFIGGIYHEKLKDFSSEIYSSLEIPARSPYGDGVNEVLGIFDTTRKMRQEAIFGEISYDLLKNLTLTAGGRFYRHRRNTKEESSGWFTDAPLGAPDTSVLALDKSGDTFKANLAYKATEQAMLYASWAQGFRLGRTAVGLFPGICDTNGDGIVDGSSVTLASTREIDSDNLDSMELGGKFTLLDDRLTVDISIYRIDWTGLPTEAHATCGGSDYFYVANAGEAKSQGIEMQSSYRFARGLRIDVGASYTNAELTTDAPELDAVSGARLPGSPKWIASLGVQYDFTLSGHKSFARADSSYRGTFPTDMTGDSLMEAGGYVLVDVRAGMSFNRVKVELFVNNVTDIDDYMWRFPNSSYVAEGYVARPRTVGLQLGYDF